MNNKLLIGLSVSSLYFSVVRSSFEETNLKCFLSPSVLGNASKRTRKLTIPHASTMAAVHFSYIIEVSRVV